ncbi:hypothetical protein [Methylobacterium symbioticum]|uniref:Uncharacterized protein n=1 Tax=Methylobacterium symbioticum TaxID=2584084 RepID=A0A509EEE6_9HYPH|nr:hypothetical protein [Methylobacterium symbioticum]VUD71809.1 hypothetical protein MET9862_02397 [Methylobacterium symbioticum]
MSARTRCIVPFCGCTAATARIHPSTEWICQRHWRLVPRATKARWWQVKHRRRRIWRRLGDSRVITKPGPLTIWNTANRLCARTWERCKAEAIEMAGGI